MSTDEAMRAEIGSIRQSLSEVKSTMSKMADALERLARLEERHANTASALDRAFSALNGLETRIEAIERQQPVQKLTSDWVINLVWAVVGMAATLLVKHFTG